MTYLGRSSEDGSVLCVNAADEDAARDAFGDLVGSDGDEFEIVPLPDVGSVAKVVFRPDE